MEACVVICRTAKPKARKGKILFVNAVNEVTRERAQSFLTDDNIEHIVKAYERFKDEPGFTRIATMEEIRVKDGNLSIPLYVNSASVPSPKGQETVNSDLAGALSAWLESSQQIRASLQGVVGYLSDPKAPK